MSEVTINRRQAVRAAAGVAAGGLLVAGAGAGSASAASSDLLGTWLVTHEDDDGESGLSLASFIADGVIVANDIRPAGSVGTGSWEDKETTSSRRRSGTASRPRTARRRSRSGASSRMTRSPGTSP